MARTVEAAYGNALFQLATMNTQMESMVNEARMLRDILINTPDALEVLTSPDIDSKNKENIINNTFSKKLSKNLIGLLLLVINKDREEYIVDILEFFIAKGEHYLKIGKASCISAFSLSEGMKEKIKQKLLQTTGYSQLDIEYVVDESIIGGIILRVDNRIVDNSIKSKLDKLSTKLRKTYIVS